MTLEQRILALAQAMGSELKATRNLVGLLSALSTVKKTSIVEALNEVVSTANGIGPIANLNTAAKGNLVLALNEVLDKLNKVPTTLIRDADNTGTQTTYSIDKITALIAQMRSDVLSTITGGITDTTMDTLKEIADFLKGSAAGGLVDSLAKRVSVNGVQTFTAAEQKTARDNIAAAGAADLQALANAMGNTDKDFAGAFTTALA